MSRRVRRVLAIAGSAVFLVVAPGFVAGWDGRSARETSCKKVGQGAPFGPQPAPPGRPGQTTRKSFGVGVRISQPLSVTTTVSSMRTPPKPSM
jgi:hypothetical protein